MFNRKHIRYLQQSIDWLQKELTSFKNDTPEVEVYCKHHKQPEVYPAGWNGHRKYAQGITAAAYVTTSVQPMEIVVPFDMGQKWAAARWDLEKKRYEFIKCPHEEVT